MAANKYESAQDFLAKTDAGELDGQFAAEIKKLSKEQLEQLAQALVEREAQRRE